MRTTLVACVAVAVLGSAASQAAAPQQKAVDIAAHDWVMKIDADFRNPSTSARS